MYLWTTHWIQRVVYARSVLPILPEKNPIIRDKKTFKDHHRRTENSAFDVMRRLFIGHGLPKSLMLWSSTILWFAAPMVNLFYIQKSPQIAFTNIANGFDLWPCQIRVKTDLILGKDGTVIRKLSGYIYKDNGALRDRVCYRVSSRPVIDCRLKLSAASRMYDHTNNRSA